MSQFDQESIVYGVIRHLPSSEELSARRERRNNWAAVQDLPLGFDDECSLLKREMFSLSGEDAFSGAYQTQIVHFAGSYRAVEYEWENWLRQFEALLKSMYWVSATVHLETELSGKHTFNWQADEGKAHMPSDADLRMSCEWEREAAFVM